MSNTDEFILSVASLTSSSSAGRSRILVNAETLRNRKIWAGQAIVLHPVGQGEGKPALAGIAWPSFTLNSNSVQIVQDSDLPCPLKSGDSVVLKNVPSSIPVASLKLRISGGGSVTKVEQILLLSLAKESLVDATYALLGDRFTLRLQGSSYVAQIASALSGSEGAVKSESVLRISRASSIALEQDGKETTSLNSVATMQAGSRQSYEDLGGLDRQVEEIRELVELPLRRPELFSQYGLRPPKGVLLFGPPGTGKTTLARLAAASVNAHVLVINGPELSSSFHGETEQRLRAVFAEAKRRSPCVIVIDEIDALAPRRDEGSGERGAGQSGAGEVERRTVATLLTLLDGVEQPGSSSKAKVAGMGAATVETPRVVVIAATNRPNAIDPALRRPGRLDREIEVGIPNADNRAAILRVMLRKVPHCISDRQIDEIASQTHGYVGADLSSLVREAGMHVIRRISKAGSTTADVSQAMESLSLAAGEASSSSSVVSNPPPQLLNYDDLQAARHVVRASAMREITLDPPKVYWRDIVSTGDTQLRVREAVEWPLKHAPAFRRLGIRPPRGVLLYGPPGCSKTMIAQALATESGLNFLSVKGPELYSKYVGESERAVRELFRKARAAAPSVVFLDEIDALTTTRGDGSGSVGDRVIASLLTEIDGVESVADIVVVAATNRPQVIDPALLRPGRLDRLLYVCPPDIAARRRIFELQTSKMAIASEGIDLDCLAALTEGSSGAEIMSICQEAGMMALAEDIDAAEIKQAHFEEAAKSVRKRITPALVASYEAWRDQQDI
ncbi:unnamed protein product [Tilletia controversa]|uniref:AAA+ ATPase domain-containing protein n=3 Tax=Tilletia TaxID=13289 RepID=A0A8X7T037_9BASI|nr:hypothetical protein CF336_g1834 [Tilletia laevis]KAE8203992.1 hypothetical protein CF328_g1334 [Tilletia controversa]KAE8263866.1 hypothetical protein A4X03_0g1360 [Tilletia caries]KAE8207264.1 hypothetical protein CF335_g1262 [Tilletia laevis]KAE8253402.1 hypothetical protein A4X06_0g1479 [Tilletia controversa]